MQIGGDQLRGHLETLVLAVLEKKEAHGLEILRQIEHMAQGSIRLKEGSLYPALYRLEAAGMCDATWEGSTKGRRGPRRRIYRISAKGRKELAKGREQWAKFTHALGLILGPR